MARWWRWSSFWLLWGGGIVLFLILFPLNEPMVLSVSPNGIGDHRAAGTAVAVDTIQQAWRSADVIGAARLNLFVDVVFLTIYSIGGMVGGRLVWQGAHSPQLRKFALIVIPIFAIYGLSDAVETIAQIIQIIEMSGNDSLAQMAVLVRPLTIVTFLIGTITMIAALLWYRSEGTH